MELAPHTCINILHSHLHIKAQKNKPYSLSSLQARERDAHNGEHLFRVKAQIVFEPQRIWPRINNMPNHGLKLQTRADVAQLNIAHYYMERSVCECVSE